MKSTTNDFIELNLFSDEIKNQIVNKLNEIIQKNKDKLDNIEVQYPVQFQGIHQDCFEIRFRVLLTCHDRILASGQASRRTAMFYVFIFKKVTLRAFLLLDDGKDFDLIETINNSLSNAI